MTSSKKNVKIGQLLICGAIILSTLQACQQKNEASSNSEDTITKITVQTSEEEKSDKPQIENAKQVVDGAFPDGLDFSNITYGVIENMNGVHDLQTCLRLNKDSGNFIELKDYINGTTWVESSKKYEDVQKLKGRYLYLMPDGPLLFYPALQPGLTVFSPFHTGTQLRGYHNAADPHNVTHGSRPG